MQYEEKLAVLGSGTMGHSIALAIAWAGYDVKVWGNSATDIERGRKGILEKLDVLASYDVIREEEKKLIASRVEFTLSVRDCVVGASFVIEAIPEILSMKQEWFQKLDSLCSSEVILASNTSGLSPTEIALRTTKPERILVTHFWNPAHLIPLVEVVRGEKTSEKTIERTIAFLRKINKKPILLKKEILGSIGNRLQ